MLSLGLFVKLNVTEYGRFQFTDEKFQTFLITCFWNGTFFSDLSIFKTATLTETLMTDFNAFKLLFIWNRTVILLLTHFPNALSFLLCQSFCHFHPRPFSPSLRLPWSQPLFQCKVFDTPLLLDMIGMKRPIHSIASWRSFSLFLPILHLLRRDWDDCDERRETQRTSWGSWSCREQPAEPIVS